MATPNRKALLKRRMEKAIPQEGNWFRPKEWLGYFVIALDGEEQPPREGRFGEQTPTLVAELRLSETADFKDFETLKEVLVGGAALPDAFKGTVKLGKIEERKSQTGNRYIALNRPSDDEYETIAGYIMGSDIEDRFSE